METYGLVEVKLDHRAGHVDLWCTHTRAAEELLADLQRRFPWRIKSFGYRTDDGDKVLWTIDRCQGKQAYALWWMIRQLCSRGWEPFGAGEHLAQSQYFVFRKRIEAGHAF